MAGGEGVESAEAGGELGGGEAVLAIELTEKVGSRLMALARIAFEAAGNEIAIGIAAGAELRDDVVEAAGAWLQTTETVEAKTAVASMNGLAERLR